MRSPDLGADYIRRAQARLAAVDALFKAQSWADVVRESQEVVELALKGLLRVAGIEPPRIHDVSEVLTAEKSRLPQAIQPHVEALAAGSRMLRRDRELAFYGAEDLTPSGFYTRGDASAARDIARKTVAAVAPHAPLVE
jgi:HEPN domain-containing protein